MESRGKSILIIQRFISDVSEQSFKGLFNFYFPKLTSFAFTFTHNYTISEDVVMEVLEKVWNNRAKLKNVSNLKSYLYTSVRNKCIDLIRKNTNILATEVDNYNDKLWLTEQNPENILIEKELSQKLNDVITHLPPKSKAVYMLIKEDGFTYNEAAELLNISPKTVDYHVSYAMSKIREGIRAYLDSSGNSNKSAISRSLLMLFM